MKINHSKTKIMPFNFSKKYDFIPTLALDSNDLEVTYKTKLLGVICCSNGKWDQNAKYLASKGNSRLYFLRRLKSLGATQDTLKEVYTLFVRSILEMCAPLWTGALGKKSCDTLEHVQHSACKIINPNLDYKSSLDILDIVPLKERRVVSD